MGTWGVGIFDDDFTCDVRDSFEDNISDDISIPTKKILQQFHSSLEDDEEGPLIFFALAALQLDHGTILSSTREKVLSLLNAGKDSILWDEPPELERKTILDDLRERVESAQMIQDTNATRPARLPPS